MNVFISFGRQVTLEEILLVIPGIEPIISQSIKSYLIDFGGLIGKKISIFCKGYTHIFILQMKHLIKS